MLQSIEENGVDTDPDDENNNNDDDQLESWARIQQNTFINWINDKLRAHDITCTNLKGDLKVGCLLAINTPVRLRDNNENQRHVESRFNHKL